MIAAIDRNPVAWVRRICTVSRNPVDRDCMTGASVSAKQDTPIVSVERASELTAAERRVAELAAEGMTNREIAQTLFVTVKTVEWHLRNTYVKLRIGSRHDLRGLALSRRRAAA